MPFYRRFSFTGILLAISALTLLAVVAVRSARYLQQQDAKEHLDKQDWYQVESEETTRLKAYFDRLHRIGAFNGSVLVARRDTVIFHQHYGWADILHKRQITDSSTFQLASVSKPIIATAILQLAEKGHLDLDGPVKYYLPGFPYDDITVKHLLQHSSGLTDYLRVPESSFPFPDSAMSNANILYWLSTAKPRLAFRPGARFMYCNTNFVLLALIVERVSGRSLEVYLQKNIFGQLGMQQSILMRHIDQAAATYGHNYGGHRLPTDQYDQTCGDKGIGASAFDLFLFSRGWFEGKLLKTSTIEMAQSDSISARKAKRYYTLGWRMAYDELDRKIIYHNGWWRGYRSALHRRLQDEVTVVVLSNRLSKATYRSVQGIFDILDEMDPETRKNFEED